MLDSLIERLILKKARKEWRHYNRHNFTHMVNRFDIDCVVVGNYTYGGIQIYNYNTGKKLRIGNFCSIAKDVMFVLNADHYMENISTYPFKVKIAGEKYEAISKGNIVIDDDVWIGYRATIMSGVHIGQGAVIAAGAVVTKDVPPYAVVGGVPAHIIRYRFEPKMREKLLTIDYGQVDSDLILKRIEELYIALQDDKQIEWLPKKRQ